MDSDDISYVDNADLLNNLEAWTVKHFRGCPQLVAFGLLPTHFSRSANYAGMPPCHCHPQSPAVLTEYAIAS